MPKSYVKRAIKDSKNADLFISNSKWESNKFRSAFWYDGEIMEVGIPRNDILINSSDHLDIMKQVKRGLNIEETDKIVLYAPTFRKDENTDCYKIDANKVIDYLNKTTGDNWVFLIRLHPNVSHLFNKIKCKNAIDTSQYPDLYELLISTDILISDYSSLVFDYGYLKRPVYLFATDIEEYKKDRDFEFDLEKLPFPICRTNQELISQMKKNDEKAYLTQLNNFFDEIGLNETGKSAQEIAKRILKEMGIK